MQILKFREDDNQTPSVLDNVREKCHWMQVECQVGHHPNIISAYIYSTKVCSGEGNNHFRAKFVFKELAHLLHDTTPDDVSAWFDEWVAHGPDFIGYLIDQIHEDIDSNAFLTISEFKESLENTCRLDSHSHKDRIFELARFSTEISDVISDLTVEYLHQLANNYLHIACVFIPRDAED